MNQTMTQENKPLDKVEVKIALVKLGWSQMELAKQTGYSKTCISEAINHGMHPNVVAAIKKTLNL